MEKMVRLSGS